MRWIPSIFLSIPASLLLLTACENASAPGPETKPFPGISIQGKEWTEQHPPGVTYFAGSFLTLILGRDSAVVIENRFTDMVECDRDYKSCSDARWQNWYIGSYAMDDSLLTLSFAFSGTTANRLTGNEHPTAGVTVSRYKREGGDSLSLTLTGLGDGDVFPGKKSLILTAKPKG